MINKSSKALNDTRIELEKIYMQPFNKFKDVVKDTCSMLDLTSNSIDLQIKKFEQEEKDAKMKQIRDYFDEHNEYLINFNRCFKSNWLNKNKGIAIVRAEINELSQPLKQPENKPQSEQFYVRAFKVKVTREQAFALSDFMKTNNIEFESIKL